jgi:hypothetical protein
VLARPGGHTNVADVPLSGLSASARAISFDLDHGDGTIGSGFRTWEEAV